MKKQVHLWERVNLIPNRMFLVQTKLKSFTDDKSNSTKIMIFVFDMVI